MHIEHPAQRRAAAALSFLWRLFAGPAMVMGGVWALLTYFEPCAAATLCSGVPLIRQPHISNAPRWWQRWVLRMRLARLRARRSTEQQDIEFLQRELALTRNLLDDVQAGAQMTDDAIAWARSDLAKLQ